MNHTQLHVPAGSSPPPPVYYRCSLEAMAELLWFSTLMRTKCCGGAGAGAGGGQTRQLKSRRGALRGQSVSEQKLLQRF